MDLIRALAVEPQTTQINIVALVAGEYFSIYPIKSGLIIPVENQILSRPRISGISFDLRRVSTPIGTFGFELENTIAQKMLTTASNWLQTDCSLWIGDALNSDWLEYTKLISGIVVDISARTNGFVFNCKEMLDLVFKEFKRESVLLNAIDATIATIPVENTGLFQSAGVVRIDGEFIGYTGKTSISLTGATRGIFGSEAKDHNSLAPTYSVYHFFKVNPIDILLQLMLSKNGNQNNGTYDVLQYGLGIDQLIVDVASFEDIRTEWFLDAAFTLEVFNVGNLLTFFETEFLQPLNCRLVTTNGRITLTLLDNYTAEPLDPEFSEDIVIGAPSWKIESNKIINSVEVFFAFDFVKNTFKAKKIYTDIASIALFGVKGHKFEFKGIENDASGNSLIDRLIEKFLLRMAKSRGSINCQTYYNAYNIPLGGNVLLSHRYVPQVGIGMGISTVLENLSKSLDLGTGNVQFSLEFMSTAEFRTAIIAPYGLITEVLSQSAFTIDDIALFEVGYRVELMDPEHLYLPDPYQTIIEISGNTIVLDAPFTTPLVPGIFLKLVRYADATPLMKKNFGYIGYNSTIAFVKITPTMIGPGSPVGYFASSSNNRVVDIVPAMSSNTAPAGYIVSASQEYDASYGAWKVFNKTNTASTDCWHTLNQPTGWVKIKLPTAKIVNVYSIEARNSTDTATRSPKNWTIEGSNNDTTWTTLDVISNQTGWTQSERRTYTFLNRNSTSYLYYRINISANNGDTTYLNFAQFYLYEYTSFAWNAFDGAATEWETSQTTSTILPQWNNLSFPEAVSISKYVITNKTGTDVYAPRDWLIQGSHDGTNWVIIDQRSNQTVNTSGAVREYILQGASEKYINIRIYVTASNGGAVSLTNQTAIGELIYYRGDTVLTNFPDGSPPYTIIF